MPEYTGSYIRPCAAFPDGLTLSDLAVIELLRLELIVQDTWSENHADNDYAAVYDDDTLDANADKIMAIVGRFP